MSKLNLLIAVSVLGLSACGGGGSGSSFVAPKIVTGVFKDSNVAGLAFASGEQKGITTKDGKFTYEEGKKVTFSVGAVEIGSAKGKSVMTPLDLVVNGTLRSVEAINKTRFLMMLDKDNDANNGIEISQKVRDKAKDWKAVKFASSTFPTQNVNSIITSASVADGIEHEIVSAEVARKHLKTTLLCANAGAYAGTYTGTGVSGNIVLMVDPISGEVNGSSYNPTNQVSVDVKNQNSLDYDKGLNFVSSEDSAKRFFGRLTSTDKLEGTWLIVENNATTNRGDFSGDRIGGKSTAVYRYTATFDGDDKGVFTFDVDNANRVKGTAYSVSTNEQSPLTGNINPTNKKLTVTSEDGNSITGFIDDDNGALVIGTGVWINGTKKTSGSFSGNGCRLN